MKRVETLLIEIKKPVGDVPLVYKRLRALTRTCAQALNMTMQDSHPKAVAQLRAHWDGDSKQTRDSSEDWRSRVRTVLAQNWNARLERERLDRTSEPEAELVYAKINGTALGEETSTNITAAFNGDNVKELIALRKGFPEFGVSTSFYCGARFCSISGSLKQTLKSKHASEEEAKEAASEEDGCFVRKAHDSWHIIHEDSARIALPLWGTGKKLTELIISPAGGSHRASWRQLAAHFAQRHVIVQAEKELDAIKRTDAEKETLTRLKAEKRAERDRIKRREIETQIQQVKAASDKRMQSLKDPIEARLYGLTKLGRVGVVWKERRRKWFVTISYTKYVPPITTQGQAAAVNFGVNVFLQAFSVDEKSFHVDGGQILHKRLAFQSIRKRIQKSKRQFGKGSRGHGRRRRELPLTKRQGDETNWVETYIRTSVASDLRKWCQQHNISDVYLEDLGGVRDAFEQATQGQAHAEVKRRIHAWPHAKTVTEVSRELAQHGIRTHLKSSRFDSQRCPSCGHTDPKNVQEITIPGPVLALSDIGKGRLQKVSYSEPHLLYRRMDKTYKFECQACGEKGKADIVTCINHLQDVGLIERPKRGKPVKTPLSKMQEKAKTAISTDKRKRSRRSGT